MRPTRLLRIVCVVLAPLLIAFATPAAAEPDGWDPTLPQIISAGAPGDPLAIANASLQASAQAAQTTMDLGRKFLGSLGLFPNSTAAPGRVYGAQAIEYVIRRGGSQMGVPYSWGGGSLDGPTTGIDSGAGTVGFDCSGLMRYAFAGVGVLIPRFSGDQYTAGRHIPPSRGQAGRPDLLRARRWPARHDVPGQRPDAGGVIAGRQGHGQPGAHGWHDAVPDADHRELSRHTQPLARQPTSTDVQTPGIVDGGHRSIDSAGGSLMTSPGGPPQGAGTFSGPGGAPGYPGAQTTQSAPRGCSAARAQRRARLGGAHAGASRLRGQADHRRPGPARRTDAGRAAGQGSRAARGCARVWPRRWRSRRSPGWSAAPSPVSSSRRTWCPPTSSAPASTARARRSSTSSSAPSW